MTNQQIEAIVTHPLHYNRGQIETWDFIADHRLDYLRGNAVKYISRAGFKDARLQDLLKAKEYLKKAMANSTYVRETTWSDYEPKIDPTQYAKDQGLQPALGAAIVFICQWELGGAMFYLNQVIADEKRQEAKADDTTEAESKPEKPTVYGTDQKKFDDPRKDRRVFEFGKRMKR